MSLDKTHYDVALLSTSLPNAILSAALSSAGLSLIHLDPNDYYADAWASLTLTELHRWYASHTTAPSSSTPSSSTPSSPSLPRARISHLHLAYPAFASTSTSTSAHHPIPPALLQYDRHYALSLAPALLPATGTSIDALIASNVSSYATFRLLEHTALLDVHAGPSSSSDSISDSSSPPPPLRLARVPSSKQDVFKTKSLSLIDKRKLMKLLLHIASDDWQSPWSSDAALAQQPFVEHLEQYHKLSPALVDAVAYGVALCPSSTHPTRDAMQTARKHLQSIGRYGNSAYLVGQYGGAGELAQGYCRASAVHGAMFILDHTICSLERGEAPRSAEKGGDAEGEGHGAWRIKVDRIEETISADVVVSSDELLERIAPEHAHTVAAESDVGGDDAGVGVGVGMGAVLDTVRGLLVLDRPIDFGAAPEEGVTVGGGEREREAGATAADEATTPPTPMNPPETGLLVLPPGTVGEADARNPNTVMVLMMGEGTFSCPKGQCEFASPTPFPSLWLNADVD
ncbi:hypothetical protein ACQY0O_007980 [Thecaphora frezii]